jgi:3,2-trans-enoyl-CoA isomerase
MLVIIKLLTHTPLTPFRTCPASCRSFDASMWQALHTALKSVESDTAMKGVIIASGLQRDIFTAGNDLKELYAPMTSAQQYAKFWEAQSRLLTDLYTSRLATLAAIRGACPAGGCAIALCCDARIMTSAPGGFMGLNEVALGIPVPKYWAGVMAQVIGHAPAERLLLTGTMVQPRRAKELGMVDELIADKAALLPRAQELMAQLVKLPSGARSDTKQRIRGDYGKAWFEYAMEWEAGPEGFAQITNPATTAAVGAALQRLSGGKTKPQAKL